MYIITTFFAINCAPGNFQSVSIYVVWLGRVMCTSNLPVCTTSTPFDPSWQWRPIFLYCYALTVPVTWFPPSICWLLILSFWSDPVAFAFTTALHISLNRVNITLFHVCPCWRPFTLSLHHFGKLMGLINSVKPELVSQKEWRYQKYHR